MCDSLITDATDARLLGWYCLVVFMCIYFLLRVTCRILKLAAENLITISVVLAYHSHGRESSQYKPHYVECARTAIVIKYCAEKKYTAVTTQRIAL